MANHGQLRVLTDTQATAMRAGAGRTVCELVKIYWPAPDGAKVYSFANWKNDTVYATAISDWLGSTPLIPAFLPEDPKRRFHAIRKTSAIGDETVTMTFQNPGRAFSRLCWKWRGGVRVEVFLFYPTLPDAGTGKDYTVVSWWLGHLQTPSSSSQVSVTVDVKAGFRSPDKLVPSRNHAQNCTVFFGGQLTAAQLINHPCPYNRHLTSGQQAALGGAAGLLDGSGNPFPTCPHTVEGCVERLDQSGADLYYMGDTTVADQSQIGRGDRLTTSKVVGNETKLKNPKSVAYGEFVAKDLFLLAYAKEYHPDDDHQDKGTIRALFEVSEGPIESISEVKMMGEDLPRPDGLGLEIRLGTQGQSPTTFSANVRNYNRSAHIRGDRNPFDPNGITANQINAECRFRGRNTVRVYSDANTWTEEFTQLRAWVTLELAENIWFGYGLDRARFVINDFIYWAGLGGTFNGYVTARSARQLFYDLCLAGLMYPPFVHNGKWRFMPILTLDLNDADIPVFADTGSGKNILKENGISRLDVRYKPDEEIGNETVVNFYDEDFKFLARPLNFPDYDQQKREGLVFGDFTITKVVKEVEAFGLTNINEAIPLGVMVRGAGEFGFGGSQNNLEIELWIPGVENPDCVDLHVCKVIKVVSAELAVTEYSDPDGNPFEYFIIKELTLLDDGGMKIIAQAFWNNRCLPQSGYARYLTEDVVGNIVAGQHGSNTMIDAQGATGAVGELWPSTIDPNTIVIARWVHHVQELPVDDSYNVWQDDATVGFKVWHEGTLWVYYPGGGPATFPSGTVAAGDYLTVEYRDNNGSPQFKFKVNNSVVHTSAATGPGDPDFRGVSFHAAANVTIGETSWLVLTCDEVFDQEVGDNGVITGTVTVAPSRAVIVDRIFRDADLFAGVLGVYVGIAPTSRTGSWAAATLQVDRGGGYTSIASVPTEAVVGEAVTVLAGTDTGTETVQVEIQPGQSLLTYSDAQITAGEGFYYLGGEIFQAKTATQNSTTPNRWTLSNLSNRGAKCTEAYQGTHAITEEFMRLDSAVVFVPLNITDIGQTYDFKPVTSGQAVSAATAFSETFDAPNFVPVTPPDYSLTFDSARNEVLHDWSPITDSCFVSIGLLYEIYDDVSGSPGDLLWSGTASEWREPVSATGTRTYHFRAKNNYASGSYLVRTITITTGADGGLWGEPLFGE